MKIDMRESPEETEVGKLGIHKVELKQHPKAVSAWQSAEILWAYRALISLNALPQRNIFHTCKHVEHEDPSDGPNGTGEHALYTGKNLSTCTFACVMCCR